VVRQPTDLRHTRSVAVLPSFAPVRCEALGTAAEAELTQGLVNLGSFHVVGREALPDMGEGFRADPGHLADLGRSLGVDAVAVVRIKSAETTCTEQTRYNRTNKKSASADAMEEFKRWKAREEAAGRTVKRKGPDSDLVYAAPYTAMKYTTQFSGELELTGVTSAQPDLMLTLQDEGAFEAATQPASEDYRWYKINVLDDDASADERTYTTRLRTADAVALVRGVMQRVPAFLETRAVLPEARGLVSDETGGGAGDEAGALPGTRGRLVLVEGDDIYSDLGRVDGLRVGDVLRVFTEPRDEGSKNNIKVAKTTVTRLRVAEVFTRTCRCTVMYATRPASLEAGAGLEVE
jgi:hypothetical protein